MVTEKKRSVVSVSAKDQRRRTMGAIEIRSREGKCSVFAVWRAVGFEIQIRSEFRCFYFILVFSLARFLPFH